MPDCQCEILEMQRDEANQKLLDLEEGENHLFIPLPAHPGSGLGNYTLKFASQNIQKAT